MYSYLDIKCYIVLPRVTLAHQFIVTVTCPPLNNPANGNYSDCSKEIDGRQIRIDGDACTLTCDEGFVSSDSVSRQCGNDGSWTGSDLTCDRGQYIMSLV